MGDSHVRRLAEFSNYGLEKLELIELEFIHRGGSGTNFVLQNTHRARGFDIVIVMAGGNDIANGASMDFIKSQFRLIAKNLLNTGVKSVIFTSIWPRKDTAFNRKIRILNNNIKLEYEGNPRVTGWNWDRRQSFKTYDTVHLEKRGYKKGFKYLVSAILWAVYRL